MAVKTPFKGDFTSPIKHSCDAIGIFSGVMAIGRVSRCGEGRRLGRVMTPFGP